MSDYNRPPTAYRPTWSLETYQGWLKRNLGSAEQQKRYSEAVEWYKLNNGERLAFGEK